MRRFVGFRDRHRASWASLILVVGGVTIVVISAFDAWYHGHNLDDTLEAEVGRAITRTLDQRRDGLQNQIALLRTKSSLTEPELQELRERRIELYYLQRSRADVEVDDGWANVRTEVYDPADHRLVEQSVRNSVSGLRGVRASVLLRERCHPQRVEERLRELLDVASGEAMPLADAKILLRVDDVCRVTLDGWVPEVAMRTKIERLVGTVDDIAQAVDGTPSVTNSITIGRPVELLQVLADGLSRDYRPSDSSDLVIVIHANSSAEISPLAAILEQGHNRIVARGPESLQLRLRDEILLADVGTEIETEATVHGTVLTMMSGAILAVRGTTCRKYGVAQTTGTQTTESMRDDTWVVEPILFDSSSDHLRPTESLALDCVATVVKSDRAIGRRLQIEGHTDQFNADAYNMDLSKRRAERTRDALAARGVAADRMLLAAWGESRPVSTTDQTVNRRVEFKLEGMAR